MHCSGSAEQVRQGPELHSPTKLDCTAQPRRRVVERTFAHLELSEPSDRRPGSEQTALGGRHHLCVS